MEARTAEAATDRFGKKNRRREGGNAPHTRGTAVDGYDAGNEGPEDGEHE